VRDGELWHSDSVTIGQVLETSVSEVQFLRAVELVGQATLA
jgi:hypothetical protein